MCGGVIKVLGRERESMMLLYMSVCLCVSLSFQYVSNAVGQTDRVVQEFQKTFVLPAAKVRER